MKKRPTKIQVEKMLKDGTLVKQFENMVYGLAHKMKAQFPNEDFDEIVSEGFWGIICMAPKYNPDKGAISTWLYKCIWGHMKNMCEHKGTHRHIPTDFTDPIFETASKGSWVSNFLNELSEDASFLARTALEAPKELQHILSDTAPMTSKKHLRKYMKNTKEWTEKRIEKTWGELEECLV